MTGNEVGAQITNILTVEPNLNGDSGFSIEDEWANYFTRQQLLSDIVSGQMHPDDLLDCIGDGGHNVDAYIDGVEWALQPLL